MPTYVQYKDGGASTRYVQQANSAADGTTSNPDWPAAFVCDASLNILGSTAAHPFVIGGAVATNTAVSSAANPVPICGSDYGGTPKVQSIKVDSSGNQQHNVTQIAGTATVTSISGALGVGGDTASGSSDAGNPLKVGGVAVNAEATAVTNGQRVNAVYSLTGKQIVDPYSNPENTINGAVQSTDSSTHNLFASQGAGVRSYITTITLANTSASSVLVTLTDGTSTLYLPAPANSGCVVTLPKAFRSAAATAVTIQASSGVSTISVSAQGYKGT